MNETELDGFKSLKKLIPKGGNDRVYTPATNNHIFAMKARRRDIKEAGFYIREELLVDTPKAFPQSGFQLSAILLTRQKGDCKISHL